MKIPGLPAGFDMSKMAGNTSGLGVLSGLMNGKKTGSKTEKEETSLKPFLNMCTLIQEKRGDLQKLLVEKFNSIFLENLPLNAVDINNELIESTTKMVAEQIRSMLPEENMRILGLKLAKDAYKPGTEDIFEASSMEKFNEIYNEQLKQALVVLRKEEPRQGGGRRKRNTSKQIGGIGLNDLGGSINMETIGNNIGKLGQGITGLQEANQNNGEPPAVDAKSVQPCPEDNRLVEIFDKLYGDGKFQEAVKDMIVTKIGKIIDSDEVKKEFLATIKLKIDEIKQVIDTQLSTLITNLNNEQVMYLLMIKELGNKYVQEYYANKKQGQTLSEYIDERILSEKNLAEQDAIKGGRRRPSRKTKRRQKRRRQRRSTKNIA